MKILKYQLKGYSPVLQGIHDIIIGESELFHAINKYLKMGYEISIKQLYEYELVDAYAEKNSKDIYLVYNEFDNNYFLAKWDKSKNQFIGIETDYVMMEKTNYYKIKKEK